MDRRGFLESGLLLAGAALLPAHAFAAPDAYYAGFRAALGRHPWIAGYAGVSGPLDAGPVAFEGKRPDGLRGTLFRNGPGLVERAGQRYHHLFDGDGMVQAYTFRDDGLVHRGRFVRTRKFVAESQQGRFLFPGFGTSARDPVPLPSPDWFNPANTNVLAHGGRLLAMWEGGSAHELDPGTLETRGPVAWNRELKGAPFSAHPKVEPDGTLWNLGAFAGRLAIYRCTPDGRLAQWAVVPIDGLVMNHDFVVTRRHLVLVLPAMRLDLAKVREGHSLVDSLSFPPGAPLRVVTIDKDDFSRRRTYELPPGFLFHFGNAWEDESGVIRFDYVRHEAGAGFMVDSMRALMRGDVEGMAPAHSVSARVRLDPRSGKATEEAARENVEFPRVDPRVVGSRYRHLWHVANVGRDDNTFAMNAVLRYDLDEGGTDRYVAPDGLMLEEHVVVPRPGSSREGDGWLVGTAFDARRGKTVVQVFEALRLADGPIATAVLPYGVPLGFHGNFHADA